MWKIIIILSLLYPLSTHCQYRGFEFSDTSSTSFPSRGQHALADDHILFLDLSYSPEQKIPKGDHRYDKLVKLSLVGCNLDSLPLEVCSFGKLECLLLGSNLLTDLPNAISCLTELSEINLFCNDFEDLPDCLAALPCLTTIHIGANKMTAIPSVLYRISTLERVICYSCSIPESEILNFLEARPGLKFILY